MNDGIDLHDLPGAHGGRERAHGKPVRKEARGPHFAGFNPRLEVNHAANRARWLEGLPREAREWYERPRRDRIPLPNEAINNRDYVVNCLVIFLLLLTLLAGLALVGFVVYEYIIEPVFTFISEVFTFIFDAVETLVNAVLEAVQFVVDVVTAIGEAIEFVLNGIVAIVSFIFEVIYVVFFGIIGLILLPFWLLYEVGSYIMEVVDWFLSGLAWLFGA